MFTITNGIVIPNPETLAIWPFSQIYNRDQTSHKDRANLDWKFIEFYCSPKRTNVFGGYPSGIIRRDKIVENLRKTDPLYEVENDTLILEAIDQYMEFWNNASPSLSYYLANVSAVEKVKQSLLDLDMDERNPRTGAKVHTFKSVTDGIKNCDDVLTKLNSTRDRVEQELYDITKSKGNRSINHFER